MHELVRTNDAVLITAIEALLKSAQIEHMVVDWNASHVVPAIGTTSGPEALHTVVEQIRSSAAHAPSRLRALYSLMFEALLPIPLLRDRMADLHRDMRTNFASAITRGVAEGSVDPSVSAGRAARLFVGALRGAGYQWLLDPDHVDILDALDDVHLVIDALLPALAQKSPAIRPSKDTATSNKVRPKKSTAATRTTTQQDRRRRR